MMKKIFAFSLTIVLTLCLSSCDLNDDDSANFHFEALEVLEAEFPESFDYGQIYRIYVHTDRPTDCYYFEGFDYNHTGDTERTIYAIASVINKVDCQELNDVEMTDYFDFEVRYRQPYTFKFYTGTNTNGEEEFLVYEVPVNE